MTADGSAPPSPGPLSRVKRKQSTEIRTLGHEGRLSSRQRKSKGTPLNVGLVPQADMENMLPTTGIAAHNSPVRCSIRQVRRQSRELCFVGSLKGTEETRDRHI